MARAQLATSVRQYLMDSADAFKADGVDDGSEFDAMLDTAADDLSRFRPRTLVGSLTLVADKADYPAPDEILYPKQVIWGQRERRHYKPWNTGHLGILPRLKLISNDILMMTPSPTLGQISLLGSDYKFYYAARHIIASTLELTTVPVKDRHLLVLRTVVEALRWLAMRNINKPVRLRDGISQSPKNGTPAALADQMMKDFERQAR